MLPPKYSDLAMSATAYVTVPRPGQIMILFPQTHWGSSFYWLGHMVTTQPLLPGDNVQSWPPGTGIMFDGPIEPCVYQLSNLK